MKCAILAFYRKIVVGKRSLYLLYVVAFVIVGQGVGNFTVCNIFKILIFIFVSYTYHFYDQKASLVTGIRSRTIWNILDGDSEDPMNTTHQIINSCFQIFFDLVLLAIPIPILRKLKIRKSAKGLYIYQILFNASSKISTDLNYKTIYSWPYLHLHSVLRQPSSIDYSLVQRYNLFPYCST